MHAFTTFFIHANIYQACTMCQAVGYCQITLTLKGTRVEAGVRERTGSITHVKLLLRLLCRVPGSKAPMTGWCAFISVSFTHPLCYLLQFILCNVFKKKEGPTYFKYGFITLKLRSEYVIIYLVPCHLRVPTASWWYRMETQYCDLRSIQSSEGVRQPSPEYLSETSKKQRWKWLRKYN